MARLYQPARDEINVLPFARREFRTIATAPLWLCFVVFPLAATVSRQFTAQYFRLWLDGAWVVLTLALLMYIAVNPTVRHRFDWRPTLVAAALLALPLLRSGVCWGLGEVLEASVIPLDAKLAFYVLLVTLVYGAMGPPSQKDWHRAGAALAYAILIDTAVESIMVGGITRPQGSGEVNYDAMLLAIAIGFAALSPPPTRGERLLVLWLPLLALVATQSRTMLLSVAITLFLFARLKFTTRLAILALGIFGLFAMFLLRELETSIEAVDRYWMWVAGVDALMNPAIFFFGATPGIALNIDAPIALTTLWEQQTETLATNGIYAYNFHAFWLRFAINYGVPATLALMGLAVVIILRSRRDISRYLATVFLLAGFTMGTIYLSNVGLPFFLALATAAQWPRSVRHG